MVARALTVSPVKACGYDQQMQRVYWIPTLTVSGFTKLSTIAVEQLDESKLSDMVSPVLPYPINEFAWQEFGLVIIIINPYGEAVPESAAIKDENGAIFESFIIRQSRSNSNIYCGKTRQNIPLGSYELVFF